jgi:hypothetical protein
MQFDALVGQTLQSISMHLSEVHSAWVDARTPKLAGAYADLTLATGLTVQVQPCEVPIVGQYPALGIALSDSAGASSVASLAEAAPFLPAQIADIRLWDSLGEGPVSAVDLVLLSGVTFPLRHIYPPITLGVDIWPEGRHDP